LYFTRLKEKCQKKNSLLCIGLDPRIESSLEGTQARDAIIEANKKLIAETADLTVIYKPNSAFYEAYGAHGIEALEATLKMIPEDIDILMDSKRCDIGATAEAYAKSIFGHLKADSVTLSPYMGVDAVTPFLNYENKGIFVLCYTSNPGAAVFQDLETKEGPVFEKVAQESLSWSPNIGLVVAGNKYEALGKVRALSDDAWFLSPGIGAQGGSMEEAVRAGMNAQGYGILPVVVRGIAHADDPRKAAQDFVSQLNETRDKVLG